MTCEKMRCEDWPCKSLMQRHHVANGSPAGMRLASEKEMVEAETMQSPQM